MRKKSQDELGTLVTREMKVMLQDESLTKEQRFDLLAAVMFDAPVKNALLASFAKSLKAGFEQINGTRYKAIDRIREFKRRSERIRRHGGNMDNDTLPSNSIPIHGNPCASIPIHGELKAKAKQGNISPYKPPKGGGKVPKVVEPEDLLKQDLAEHGEAQDGGGEARPQDLANRTLACAQLVYDLTQTEAFGRMRASERSLKRCLLPLVEKNSARLGEWRQEIMDGLAAWTGAWKADDWQYAPGKITKWLVDEKYLQPPRKKTTPAEGRGCGECGAEIV